MSDDPASVVLDLRDTTYLDSAAIAMLFRLAQRLGHRRQQLDLVVGPHSPIRAVLDLTRIRTVIPVHDSVESLDPGLVPDPEAQSHGPAGP